MSVKLLDEVYSDTGGGGTAQKEKGKNRSICLGCPSTSLHPCIKDNKSKLRIMYQPTTHSKRHNSKFFWGPTPPDHPSLNILYRYIL